jgi:hypothetical protein
MYLRAFYLVGYQIASDISTRFCRPIHEKAIRCPAFLPEFYCVVLIAYS